MSKCREAFDAWWKSNGIEVANYAEKVAAKKGWQAAWNAATKNAVEICRERGKNMRAVIREANPLTAPSLMLKRKGKEAESFDCAEVIEQEIEP